MVSLVLIFQVKDNDSDIIVNLSGFSFGDFLKLFQSHSCTCGSLLKGLANQAYRDELSFLTFGDFCYLLSLKFVPETIRSHDNPSVVFTKLEYLNFRLPCNVLAGKYFKWVLVIVFGCVVLWVVEFRMFEPQIAQ